MFLRMISMISTIHSPLKKIDIATENYHLVSLIYRTEKCWDLSSSLCQRLPGRVTIKNPSEGRRHAPGLCLASVRAPEEVGLATGVGLGLYGAGCSAGGWGEVFKSKRKKAAASCLE
jgi:hypothetical protein